MMNLLKSLIKTGVGKKTDDTQIIRRAIVKWLGIEQQVESLVPFGTFGNPQEGVQYILLKRRCNEANTAGMACDPAGRIKKECKPGEFGVGNPLTLSNLYFKENGDAVVEIPKGLFNIVNTEGDIKLDADNGNIDINASGNIEADATEINLNSGSKGAARMDDKVTCVIPPGTVIVDVTGGGGAPAVGIPNSAEIVLEGTIDEASGTVIIGD